MVTMLDAHPEIAMSYELYPRLLELSDPSVEGVRAEVERLNPSRGTQFAAEVQNPRFKTFLNRTARGGMSPASVVAALEAHIDSEGGFERAQQRLDFVERCALLKAVAEGKERWGMKALLGDFSDFNARWEGTQIINVVRDGRDVLASQLNTGSFDKSPSDLGRSWASNHRKFERLAERSPALAHQVRYEQLVEAPAPTLKRLCARLGLRYAESMERYFDMDLSLYNASHLSLERVKKPPDTSSIGRWRNDLSVEQVAEFVDATGGAMADFGYTV